MLSCVLVACRLCVSTNEINGRLLLSHSDEKVIWLDVAVNEVLRVEVLDA